MNKKGMYIVEASIIMPLFICGMVMLISIIPIVSACENIVFAVSDELRLDAVKAAFSEEEITFPAVLTSRVISENNGISMFSINKYGRDISLSDIDDLIQVKFTARFKRSGILIPVNSISFHGNVVTRAFTGSYHKVGGDGFDDRTVYVFPEDGRRYHSRGCRYLEAHCHLTILTDELKNRYHACPLCGAAGAHIGGTVICFERAGEAYHMPSCRQVQREKYYTETTRSSAERAGYTPCSVCGG